MFASIPVPVLILLAVLVLSFLILIHEFGHYIAARWMGVWVEEFGIGLPPRVWGKKVGKTIYSINALPIGGFVRLHGESPDMKITKPKEAFLNKSKLARAFIAMNGIFMNFLFAILAFMFLFVFTGIPKGVNIDEVAKNSPADMAGIQARDVVREVNGREVVGVDEFLLAIQNNKGGHLSLVLERDGQEITTPMNVAEVSLIENTIPFGRIYVTEVLPGTPASESEIQVDDFIIAANGKTINTNEDFLGEIEANKGGEAVFTVVRTGEEIEVPVSVLEERPENGGLTGIGYTVSPFDPFTGVRYDPNPHEVVRPGGVFSLFSYGYYGVRETVKWSELTVSALTSLFKDLSSGTVPQGLAGPLGVTLTIAEIIRYGIPAVLSFSGIISVNLGLLNVVPIPPLDGSRVVLLGVEQVVGKKKLQKYEQQILTGGFIFMLALLVLITATEIPKILSADSLTGFVDSLFVQ